MAPSLFELERQFNRSPLIFDISCGFRASNCNLCIGGLVTPPEFIASRRH